MKFHKSKFAFLGLLIAILVICIAFFSEKEEDLTIYEVSELELDEDEDSEPELVVEQQDSVLAASIKTYLKRYKPPNAFVLLMDAKSGNILAWGQRENNQNSEEPSFLQWNFFPAASLAKIVTAAAAFENGSNPDRKFPKIGRHSTLYKRQIFPNEKYRSDTITLEDAFAKSNNPVMGMLGMELGKDELENTAKKLGFTNFNYPDSAFGLAEGACGFTQRNLTSPLQVANAIRKLIFLKRPKDFQETTYDGMRALFLKTVTDGTARKDIKKNVYLYNRNLYHIGAKTGSLDGDFPAGRYDWFAGFAESKTDPEKAAIIIVMQVHGELRNQHSSAIAGFLINDWAKR